MSAREAFDRRGRAQRGGSGLLEREAPLQTIELLIDEAQKGTGHALLIEGHPGMGKTRLHEAALDLARKRGMRVLRAAGSELEHNIAYGLAAQLLGAELSELDEAGQHRLLEAATPRIRGLLGAGPAVQDAPEENLSVAHSLFTMLSRLEPRRGLLIAIDDLHWADAGSLEFVLYMLHRLDETSVALVMSRRPVAPGQASGMLDRIATHPRVWVEALAPLGREAVAALVADALGERADDVVIDACYTATAGNPFYLHELLLTLREERERSSGELARQALALAPDAVTRIVRVRVGRLGADAADLARAVAILGDDVPLRHAAALAGLAMEDAAAAADRLAAMEILLAREPLRFVHPLVRHAVRNDIPASEQAGRHLQAAKLLGHEQADPERVAAHLLLGRAQGDPWVVEQLRAAAASAQRRGASSSAVSYLARALEEPPQAAAHADVLAELGLAEAAAGAPGAPERLAQAAAAAHDPARRAELALERGRALDAQGLHEQAARAYAQGLRELPDALETAEIVELHDQLETGYVATAVYVPSLQAAAIERAAHLLQRTPASPRSQGQRVLLAQAALQSAFAGSDTRSVGELAERAWDDGALLREAASQWLGWRLVCSAFTLAGLLERAVDVAGAAIEDARRRSSPFGFATASYMRALPLLWEGRVDEALGDLEATAAARRYGWRQFARAAAAQHALCCIEKGELDRAQELIFHDGPLDLVQDLEDGQRRYALAELRLAQGRAEEARQAAHDCAAIVERHVEFYGYCPWRTVAAQAELILGERDRALALATEAAERAEETGVLHQRIRTLRVLGTCLGGEEGIETLRRAVELGTSSPPRIETIRALIELGAALRRANQRTAAREPLGQAVDLAREGGAIALQDRARTELAATGARPRREALLSGPGSLTPSERRIAELAAGGQSNREIAQALFITPKTVEYHLRNVYRKLGIETRRELHRVLAV